MSDKRRTVESVILALRAGTATPEEQASAAGALSEASPCMAILWTIAEACGEDCDGALGGLFHLLKDAGARFVKLDAESAASVFEHEILDPRNPKAQRGN